MTDCSDIRAIPALTFASAPAMITSQGGGLWGAPGAPGAP
eukprot:gene3136-2034_t